MEGILAKNLHFTTVRRRITLMREVLWRMLFQWPSQVATHFPRLRQLLDESLSEAKRSQMTSRSMRQESTMAMPQGPIRALGGTTLEVVSLISTATRRESYRILQVIGPL